MEITPEGTKIINIIKKSLICILNAKNKFGTTMCCVWVLQFTGVHRINMILKMAKSQNCMNISADVHSEKTT